MEITRTLHVDLADQARDRYPVVPFELPAGAESFEVSLEGTEGVPGLVVDLGCEGPDGWRGWSGGARRWFVISDDDATPGYLPGALEQGTWGVVLGLHNVPAEGAEFVVRVISPARRGVDHGPVEDPAERLVRGSDRGLPAPAGLTWYAGDMHSHSLHSDGALSLWELANEGIRSGLDFLCVSDHNTTSHHSHLAEVGQRQGITLTAGQEVTTHRGHANAFGRIGFVDFRRPADEWVKEAERRGGWLSVNHPVDGDCSWQHDLDNGPHAVELYHSTWYLEPHSTSALAWFRLLRQDVGIIGGGDFHNRSVPLRPGLPTTWLAAEECTEEALLEALRAGRSMITASATLDGDVARPDLLDSPVLVRDGDELLVLAAAGLVLTTGAGVRQVVTGEREVVSAPVGSGPYWLEDSARRVLALTR